MRTRGLGNEQQLEEGEEWGRRGEGPFKDRASMSDTIKTRQGVSWSKAHRERRLGRGMRALGATLQGCTRRGASPTPARSPGRRRQLSEHQA